MKLSTRVNIRLSTVQLVDSACMCTHAHTCISTNPFLNRRTLLTPYYNDRDVLNSKKNLAWGGKIGTEQVNTLLFYFYLSMKIMYIWTRPS